MAGRINYDPTLLYYDGALFPVTKGKKEHEYLPYAPSFNSIIMKYTGRKDRDNKDIYDGDIVDIDGYGRYTIIFEAGYFQTHCIETSGLEFFMLDSQLLINTSSDNLEVIGNIYENPELLEK